jgi:hypothetical protein
MDEEVYFGKSQKWEVYFANLASWEVYFRSFPYFKTGDGGPSSAQVTVAQRSRVWYHIFAPDVYCW